MGVVRVTATLNAFGRAVADVGPIADGIVLDTFPALAATYPGPGARPAPGQTPRPLAERIEVEEARLARRRHDHHRARAALARMDRLAAELGAPDRAGAMLRTRDADKANQRMDAGLARYVRARNRVALTHARVTLSEARLRDLYAALETTTLPADAEVEQALNTDPRSDS